MQKILIVDDTESVRKMLTRHLVKLKYEVISVEGGNAALDFLKDNMVDLVLLDQMMPEMDGMETFVRIKRDVSPCLPAIMITAHGSLHLAVTFMKVGGADFVQKPIEIDMLTLKIEQVIKASQLQKELQKQEQKIRESGEHLRSLTSHLEAVREEERCSVAKDIHDELQIFFTVIKLDLSWIEKKLDEGQKPIIQKINGLKSHLDDAISTVQRISSSLRPPMLGEIGLIGGIEWLVEEFRKGTSIKFEVSIEPNDIILDDELLIVVFHIFQELLINAVRHAKATVVNIRLELDDEKLELIVKDNGRGIGENEISDPKTLGLAGMKERLYPWNGKINIHGAEGEGTVVEITIYSLSGKENLEIEIS